jgi:hypothetical protein
MELLGPPPFQQLEAVHLGHVEVEEDECELGVSGEELVAFAAVGREVNDATGQDAASEDDLIHLVMQLGVIHDEKRVRHLPPVSEKAEGDHRIEVTPSEAKDGPGCRGDVSRGAVNG